LDSTLDIQFKPDDKISVEEQKDSEILNQQIHIIHNETAFNRRQHNKEKLKSLRNIEEKIQEDAKDLIDELPKKLGEGLSFKDFKVQEIQAILIDLLHNGYSKKQLSEELIQFFQVRKVPEKAKEGHAGIFGSYPEFVLAYKLFIDHSLNKKIRETQRKFISEISSNRWKNINSQAETLLGFRENKQNIQFTVPIYSALFTRSIQTLKFDLPNLEKFKDKNSTEFDEIANLFLVSLTLLNASFESKGNFVASHDSKKTTFEQLLKLEFLNSINIDDLIEKCFEKKNQMEKDNEISTIEDKIKIIQKNLEEVTTKLIPFQEKKGEEYESLKKATVFLTKQLQELSQKKNELEENENIKNRKRIVQFFPELKATLENFKKQKLQRIKQAEHPYKIIRNNKQEFQMQQQQQQQQQEQVAVIKPAPKQPTSDFVKDAKQIQVWLGNNSTMEVTQQAFDILKRYEHLFTYGLQLSNLPQGFYINTTLIDEGTEPFLDYNSKLLLQDNKNSLTQELPKAERKEISPEYFGTMSQFKNSKEGDKELTFPRYVDKLMETKDLPQETKLSNLLTLEDSQYQLKTKNPLKVLSNEHIRAAAECIYHHGSDGIEFLFSKLNKIKEPLRETIITRFINQSKDWSEYATPAHAMSFDILANLTSAEVTWLNKLLEQHNPAIGTPLPDLVIGFKYFSDKFKAVTKQNDLPEASPLVDVNHMLIGLDRYLNILYKDPAQQPQQLDINNYNELLARIKETEQPKAKKEPEPIEKKPKEESKTQIERRELYTAVGRKDPKVIADQFDTDLNVDEIMKGMRHLNIQSPKSNIENLAGKSIVIEMDTKEEPTTNILKKFDCQAAYVINKNKVYFIDESEVRQINYGIYLPPETLVRADTTQVFDAALKNILATERANEKLLSDFKKSLRLKPNHPKIITVQLQNKINEFSGEEMDVVTRDIPQESGILAKMTLAQAYSKVNSWGYQSSRVIQGISHLAPTDEMKRIVVQAITPKKAIAGLKFPMSLYDLLEKTKQNVSEINVEISADISTIPKAIKDMTSDEIKEHARECRKIIAAGITEDTNKEQLIETKLFYLSLLREGMYRADKQARFANSTQILSIVNETIFNEGNSFAQIGTGQGKSLITALMAAMLSAEGQTVDICTSDAHLANEAAKEFAEFYKFFEIPCASEAISAKPNAPYKIGGVNYSDVTNLALYRSKKQIETNNPYFAGKTSAILDEADYIVEFPTTIRYSLGTGPSNVSEYSQIYKILNDFIDIPENEKLNNITDKRTYLIEQASQYIQSHIDAETIQKAKDNGIDVLDYHQLDKWLAAAWNAKHLAETGLKNKKIHIDTQLINEKYYSFAQHVINNKVDPDAQLMDGGQQFLQARMQTKSDGHTTFPIEAEQPAITSVTSMDFVEYYRKTGGKIKGHTGFIGDQFQLDAIASKHDVQSTSYPTHQRKQRIDQQQIFKDEAELDQAIFKQIQAMGKQKRPILLLCKNAEEAKKMADKVKNFKEQLKDGFKYNINLFTATDREKMLAEEKEYTSHGMTENEAIDFANEDFSITISDASLGRGKDFKPKNPAGLHVIQNYLGTQADIEQGMGRAGRKGAKGSSFHGVTLQELGHETNPHQDIPARLTDARNRHAAQLRKESIFNQAFSNISSFFSEQFLFLSKDSIVDLKPSYQIFLSRMKSIWKETLAQYVDRYTYKELETCFNTALTDVLRVWNQSVAQNEQLTLETIEGLIKLPVEKVEVPNHSVELAPAMTLLDMRALHVLHVESKTYEDKTEPELERKVSIDEVKETKTDVAQPPIHLSHAYPTDEQDNPGKGPCLFYSFTIALMPALREEIWRGSWTHKDSLYKKIKPFIPKAINDYALQDLILSFDYRFPLSNLLNVEYYFPNKELESYKTLDLFADALRKYVVVLREDQVLHAMSEAKQAPENKEDKKEEQEKQFYGVRLHDKLDHYSKMYTEIIGEIDHYYTLYNIPGSLEGLHTKVDEYKRLRSGREEVYHDKQNLIMPVIKKCVEGFKSWSKNSTIDEALKKQVLYYYVTAKLFCPSKAEKIEAVVKKTCDVNTCREILAIEIDTLEYNSPFSKFNQDKERASHWGRAKDAGLLGNALGINLVIMENGELKEGFKIEKDKDTS
jgi:hypothetical protein